MHSSAPVVGVDHADTVARIALAVAGVGGNESVAEAIEFCGSADRFVSAVHDRSDSVFRLTQSLCDRIRALATGPNVARVIEKTRSAQLTVLTPADPAWPTQLSSLGGRMPLLLWASSGYRVLVSPAIAFVGSDVPTRFEKRMAIELVTGLAAHGWTVVACEVDGLQRLVLRSAGAMRATPIDVRATGLTGPHSADTAACRVSEMPPGAAASAWSRRRALMIASAIATKTIIVEAEASRDATRLAEDVREIGRPVGVLARRGPRESNAEAGHATERERKDIASARDADWLR